MPYNGIKAAKARESLNNPKTAKEAAVKTFAYTYPQDLTKQPVYFTLQFKDYQSLSGRATVDIRKEVTNSIGFKPIELTNTVINLPIPSGLNDNFDISYRDVALKGVGGVQSTIEDVISKGPEAIVGSLVSGGIQKIRELTGIAAAALGDLAKVGAEAQAAAQLEFGAIANPNLALLFEGVELRQHRFRWKFIASNEKDSETIQAIIKAIQTSALPTKELEGNFALNFPRIAYAWLRGPERNSYIYFSRKGGFIKNVSVSYDGQSYPAFFKGPQGTFRPVEIDLSITLSERAIVTREDLQ